MKSHNTSQSHIPQGLSAVAGNRDFIQTPEIAQVFNIKPQTVRKNYCLTGEVYGIRPIKMGNRLLWSVAEIAARLEGAK
jgi:hypothetical protein